MIMNPPQKISDVAAQPDSEYNYTSYYPKGTVDSEKVLE